jgi:hypothetical protein
MCFVLSVVCVCGLLLLLLLLLLLRSSRFTVFEIMTRPLTGQPRNCGSIRGKTNIFFPSPKLSDRLWGLSNLLFLPGVNLWVREACPSSHELRMSGTVTPLLNMPLPLPLLLRSVGLSSF